MEEQFEVTQVQHMLETDAYFRELCENLGVALIATDEDLKIRFWNAAAARMFGAAAGRMIGSDAVQAFPADRREAAGRMLRRAVESGETGEVEFQDRDGAGELRELAAIIAPVLSDGSSRIGASICFRDITRRINLQNDLLENRKMAALGEMAGAVAHHFNNILGGVVTSVDYASESADNPAITKRILSQASRSIIRAVTLVNGLLAFAERSKFADDLSDVTEVLNEVVQETEARLAPGRIKLVVEVEQLPVVAVPRQQLTTILRNIIQNAIEAMPVSGMLKVEAHAEEERVKIRISDTGKGIDPAQRSRLFEPFWTTKEAAADSPNTVAGLGLAIAHGLTHILGGTISAESEVNKGSTFTVSLPTRPVR